MTLRSARPVDRESLNDICLRTGNAGGDASEVEDAPELLGLVFVEPYLAFAPDCVFVAEDAEGICGYALGVADTVAFSEWASENWYPPLRKQCSDPGPDRTTWYGSDWVRHWIHHPPGALPPVLADFPAHGHIDLLPRAQAQGIAEPLMHRLMASLASKGAPGLHLGVDPRNQRALRFYTKLGFAPVAGEPFEGAITVSKKLSSPD